MLDQDANAQPSLSGLLVLVVSLLKVEPQILMATALDEKGCAKSFLMYPRLKHTQEESSSSRERRAVKQLDGIDRGVVPQHRCSAARGEDVREHYKRRSLDTSNPSQS